MATVCEFYNLKSNQIKGDKRDRGIVVPRQILMYLLRAEMGISLIEVGKILGGRDHTTIMHGVDKMGNYVQNKEKVSEDIVGITRTLRG